MRQFRILIFSFALIAVCAGASAAAEKGKPLAARVAVFDFDDSGSGAAGVGRAVSDMLISRLTESGLFLLYERARLEELLKEQNYAGPAAVEQSVKAGKVAGVTFVIIGKVSEFGVNENSVLIPTQGTVNKYRARVRLDVRLVHVATGRILQTWTTAGAKTSYNLGINIMGIPNFDFTGPDFQKSLLGQATRAAAESAAGSVIATFGGDEIQNILKRERLAGRVADVEEGRRLIINLGRSAGIGVGDTFRIWRVDGVVTDPDTGAVLTEKRRLAGEAIVTKTENDYCNADMLTVEPDMVPQVKDVAELQGAEPKETDAAVP